MQVRVLHPPHEDINRHRQKGERRGTALGFPTANVAVPYMELSGIYAARVLIEGREYEAGAFADRERNILEAHILDFSGDLYGKEITIELCKKIRDNMQFSDDTALRAAIADDVASVRTHFSSLKTEN